MFDLIEGKVDRPFRDRRAGPTIVSMAAHVAILLLLVVMPLLYFTNVLPEVPEMMAFVAAAPAPPPPPPPPPAAAKAAAPPARPVEPVPVANPNAAPVEAPSEIKPEPPTVPSDVTGVEGGVPGGVPGGVFGGVLGGIAAAPPPPPPPPPPARARGPVRIGGQLKAPALVRRVEPEYPALAIAAKVRGIVILEATVDEEGQVTGIRVLQSQPLLDAAAIAAVRQWRYSPLVLNDRPTSFVLTVTLGFSFQ